MKLKSISHLPRADDKTFVVTGGNAGIGYFVAEQLAMAGARVIIASRDKAKAQRAIDAIESVVPGARTAAVSLDLSSLDSIAAAALAINGSGRIDGVILNAGVLAQERGRSTLDGHELVFGTNHLGNFAFALQLLPAFEGNPNGRLITMGSIAHRFARPDARGVPAAEESPFRTYAGSKLAQMLFALELDRRLRSNGSRTMSLIAHPGGALDGLTPARPPAFSRTPRQRAVGLLRSPIAQSKEHAAWPAVRASLDPDAAGGQLWGPRFASTKGAPKLEAITGRLADRSLATSLWQYSEAITGINFR